MLKYKGHQIYYQVLEERCYEYELFPNGKVNWDTEEEVGNSEITDEQYIAWTDESKITASTLEELKIKIDELEEK